MSDINVKEIEYSTDKYDTSFLKLELYGNNIFYPIVNALRKVCINQIPIYAFHPSKINITRNNSVFDNSYMRDRLSQIPINKFNHKIKFLALKYYKDVNFSDNKRIRHEDDDNEIEIFVKAKNVGPAKVLDISTNDIKLTINDEIIPTDRLYSKDYPILLIQLRQDEEFECSMKGVVAIGEYDAIFNASNTYYEEITENKYYLMVESFGQFSEYEILIRACDIILEKLDVIKENVVQNQYQIIITENNAMVLEILNEDYTCGGPINYFLQNMNEVIFSGINNPDYMQKNIVIKFKVNESNKPIDVFNKAVDESVKLFNKLKEKFTLLDKGTKVSSTKTNNSHKIEKSKEEKTNIKKKSKG
jgi:DNA-directed RNA polymerase subunit L